MNILNVTMEERTIKFNIMLKYITLIIQNEKQNFNFRVMRG